MVDIIPNKNTIKELITISSFIRIISTDLILLHWGYSGDNFLNIHELSKKAYDDFIDIEDSINESLRVLNIGFDFSSEFYIKLGQDYKIKMCNSNNTYNKIERIVSLLDVLRVELINKSEDVKTMSLTLNDILISSAKTVEKYIYLFRSHLNNF